MKKSTILIVEDNVEFLESLHFMLDSLYDIIDARTPEDAIDVLSQKLGTIEAVVLDMQMPHRGSTNIDPNAGVDVLKALDGGPDKPPIDPFMVAVVLSAYPLPADPIDVRAVFEARGIRYILKGSPGWDKELLRAVEMAVSTHEVAVEILMGHDPEDYRRMDPVEQLMDIKRRLRRVLADLEDLCPDDLDVDP